MASREELIQGIESIDKSMIEYLEATVVVLKRARDTKLQMLKKLNELGEK